MEQRKFIAYYLDSPWGVYHRLLRLSAASAKKVIPDCEVIFLTPEYLPIDVSTIPEIDHVYKIPSLNITDHYAYRRCMAQSHVNGGNCLFLDVDTWINKDPFPVFDEVFDIAVTTRQEDIEGIPYNGGVVFSRDWYFWERVARSFPPIGQRTTWRHIEGAFCKIVQTGDYTIKILDGKLYNYTPKNPKDIKDSYILHYKGHRKDWMLKRG